MANESDSTQRSRSDREPDLPPGGAAAPVAKTGAGAERRPARKGPGGTVAGRNGRPTNPEEMRREIERTRARMSGTLDALEARIVYERESLERKKDDLVDRVTLRSTRERLSREPWRSIALAFVAGYIVAAIRD